MEQSAANATPQESKNAPKTRGGIKILIWFICSLLILYPLSFGPALWVIQKFPGMKPHSKVFYSPLTGVCAKSDTLDRLLDWYVFDVWRIPRS
jgi:hypothetical protein